MLYHYQFLKKKKFSINDFGKLHPGGNIGAKFIKIKEIMHKSKNSLIKKYNKNERYNIKNVSKRFWLHWEL